MVKILSTEKMACLIYILKYFKRKRRGTLFNGAINSDLRFPGACTALLKGNRVLMIPFPLPSKGMIINHPFQIVT